MLIRPIEPKDFSDVSSIYNYYILNSVYTFDIETTNDLTIQKYVTFQNLKYKCFVVEDQQKIIGYGYFAPFNPKDAYSITATITIYLDPSNKIKGLGQMLYNQLENECKQANIQQLIAIITEENKRSKRFFEKNGFIQKGTLEHVGNKMNRLISIHYYQKNIK